MNAGACGAFVHGLEDEFMGKEPSPYFLAQYLSYPYITSFFNSFN